MSSFDTQAVVKSVQKQMSCLFSLFSSSRNQTKKRPKLPTFDLEEEPKPTFCVYDSDDSDIENNNVKKFDVQTIKYYECCLGKGKICKQSPLLFSVIYFCNPEKLLIFSLSRYIFCKCDDDGREDIALCTSVKLPQNKA